jgi:hypothetical protein
MNPQTHARFTKPFPALNPKNDDHERRKGIANDSWNQRWFGKCKRFGPVFTTNATNTGGLPTLFLQYANKTGRNKIRIKLRYFYPKHVNNSFMRGLGSGASVASLAKLPRCNAGATAVWRTKQIPLRASKRAGSSGTLFFVSKESVGRRPNEKRDCDEPPQSLFPVFTRKTFAGLNFRLTARWP